MYIDVPAVEVVVVSVVVVVVVVTVVADFGRAAARVFQSKIDCPSVLVREGGRGEEVRGGDSQCGWVSDACVCRCET